MLENFFPPLMILGLLITVIIMPWAVDAGMRRIKDPVPFRLPLLLSVLVVVGMGAVSWIMIPSLETTSIGMAIVWFLLTTVLIALGAITPYYWFYENSRITEPRLIFSLFSFVGLVLWLFTTLGEQRVGGPYSPFFPALPLTGWFLDGLASLSGTGSIVYSASLPVYSVLHAAGLWLEVFIIAGMYFFVMQRR